MNTPLPDLLFVDHIKLDSFVEIAYGSLSKIDPEIKKSFELGLTGIKVKLEETDKSRSLTDPEKLELIEKHLKTKNSLKDTRPTMRHEETQWVKETTDAYRVVVPNSPFADFSTPGFAFWLSPGTPETGILCAVEGSSGDERQEFDYSKASTYSVLQSLVHFTRQQNRAGVLDSEIPRGSHTHPNPHAEVDETHPPSLIDEYYNVKPFAEEFAKSPVQLLRQWKCMCSELRKVTILYRAREYGPDLGYDWKRISTFGYALSVHE